MFIKLLVFMSNWDWERETLSRWGLRFSLSKICVQWGCGGALSANHSFESLKVGVWVFLLQPQWEWKARHSFAMKRRMPSYHSHLCFWRQISPIDVKANCSFHRRVVSLAPTLPPKNLFLSSINICKNAGKHFCAYLSMNSIHGQHQVLLFLPSWCILTTRIPEEQPSPSVPSWE